MRAYASAQWGPLVSTVKMVNISILEIYKNLRLLLIFASFCDLIARCKIVFHRKDRKCRLRKKFMLFFRRYGSYEVLNSFSPQMNVSEEGNSVSHLSAAKEAKFHSRLRVLIFRQKCAQVIAERT